MSNQETIELFEYGSPEILDLKDKDIESFDKFLKDIWDKRESKDTFRNDVKRRKSEQKFIDLRRGIKKKAEVQVSSNDYVGVINWKGLTINLLPKIFDTESQEKTLSPNQTNAINTHILWWLSYSKKFRFPHLRSSVSKRQNNFLEVLIYQFAKHTVDVLSKSTYQSFEDVENELRYMKGSLDFKKYISTNFTKGRQHILNCRYNSLEIDNKFNRIVKFVCRLLLLQAKTKDSKDYLSKIILLMSDVKDQYFQASDCESIRFNSFFRHMQIILDYCKLFLSGSIINRSNKKLEVFAFLIKTDMLYQDFVYGFIQTHVQELEKINVSKTSHYGEDSYKNKLVCSSLLDNSFLYEMNPDGILRYGSKEFITDTKYKDIDENPKKPISQDDLYQMLAYSTRFKIKDIILFYPEYKRHKKSNQVSFTMRDKLANEEIIVRGETLGIINKQWENDSGGEKSLNSYFKDVKNELILKLKLIFK